MRKLIGGVLMNSLVIRPNPIDNEHILGYVLRIIRLNYIHDAYHFLSLFTHTKSLKQCLSNIFTQDFNIELFSSYLRKDPQVILALLFQDQELEIPVSNVPTICSFCYAEQGFINKKWMSPLHVICEKHLVFLTNKCKHCDRVFEWHFLQFYTCRTCKQKIISDAISPLLQSNSPYLDYILNKKNRFTFSERQLADILSFFLILTKGYSFYYTQNSFYRMHDFSQENILESYDSSLNYFLKYNLFENFLIQSYENTPYDIQSRNRIYECFSHIDQYINDKSLRLKLIDTIKKCYFLKNKISKPNFKKITSIIYSNSCYHNDYINVNNFGREIFDLVKLFQFKYITKTNASTLDFLLENSFIDALKCKNGNYKYISIYSLYKLMSVLKVSSSLVSRNDEQYVKKFSDLDVEQKKNFLYSILNGQPYKYEYDVLIGIDGIKVVMHQNLR